MIFFTIAGLVWVSLMALRLPTLRVECRLFVRSFQAGGGYTKTQARWVTFKHIFIPSLLAAPALVVLERSAFYQTPLASDIHGIAQGIDAMLKERAGLTTTGE